MVDKTAFPPKGLTYFWMLNDACRLPQLREQMRAFADAGTHTLVLHPRPGLLVPFAGRDWFELITALTDDIADMGMHAWLYDEDYCPSGQAGGWIVAEHPEHEALHIERYEADANVKPGELFLFPTGKLLWAGIVPNDPDGDVTDMTDRTGIIRAHWEASEWDSRFYYANTPLYPCPRSAVVHPQFALQAPKVPDGCKLLAFVARPAAPDASYRGLVDSLSPAATEALIVKAYEPYKHHLGDRLGTTVTALFTDEPKYFGAHPWTGALFEGFEQTFGYDLRQRLDHLFNQPQHPTAMLTRSHYRQWVGRRFRDAWLQPIADWCHGAGIKLVGHMSPEDDPSHQATSLSNLFPLEKPLDLPGLDLIIPAVGDGQHPMINVGVTTGASCVQQQNKPTACSEILGASGNDLTTQQAARVLGWQVMSGVGAPVIHGAFASVLGLRLLDAPPDCGPDSPRWPGMVEINRNLLPLTEAVTDSTQTAPVAILWPIRTFLADLARSFHADQPYRDALERVLLACLEAQVGVHLLDEKDFQQANVEDGRVALGRARYSHLLLPSTTVLHEQTLTALHAARNAGVKVALLGDGPQWVEGDTRLSPVDQPAWDAPDETDDRAWCIANLPRLDGAPADATPDLRMTVWEKNGATLTLAMNLGSALAQVAGIDLPPGVIVRLDDGRETHRFDPAAVTPNLPAPATLALGDWQVRMDDGPWQPLEQPMAVYRIFGAGDTGEPIALSLTGAAAVEGKPVARTVTYRAKLTDCNGTTRAHLRLEPTAARGEVTIALGEHTWQASLNDLHNDPFDIPLDVGLADGARDLTLTFEHPTDFDGLHVAPVIYIQGH